MQNLAKRIWDSIQKNKRKAVIISLIVVFILLGGLTGVIVSKYAELPSSSSEKQYGSISGKVVDDLGGAVAGVTVTVFGTKLSALTNSEGNYRIDNVPVTAPRYIVTAVLPGFIEGQAGNVDIANGETTEVNLKLQIETAGNMRCKEKLSIKLCYLMKITPTTQMLLPVTNAVLDPSLYPEKVEPYLKPGKYIASDDPSIVELAQHIKNSLLPWDKNKQTKVARAVYDWMVKNIEYDSIENYPGDVTCGNWQTTYGGWGHSFSDWCYTAKLVLEQRRAISIECDRLCTALLRAAGIPARPALVKSHPVTQWWVQLPDGSGYWANMDTSAGRTIYKQNGDLWAKFPAYSESDITFYTINEHAPIHLDWYTTNDCIWLEDYGERRVYQCTADGLKSAERDIEMFMRQGKIPLPPNLPPDPPPVPGPHYELYSRGFTIDLANIGNQESLEVKLPLFKNNEYRELLKELPWTNHPDWISWSLIETEQDARTGEELSYYKTLFNLIPQHG